MFKLKCACDYCIDQEQIPNQLTRFTEIKKQTKEKNTKTRTCSSKGGKTYVTEP
jgi:hypothetical protein